MSKGGATAIVFITGALLAGIALLNGGKTYKKIWAAGVLTTGLSIFADFAPEVVGPFALLIIIAALAKDQGAIGSFLGTKAPATASAQTG